MNNPDTKEFRRIFQAYQAIVEGGRKGGKSKSAAKIAAVRRNGKLGGKPKVVK